MTEKNAIVVDTNIWLDYLLGYRPGSKSAKEFFTLARKIEAPLVISPNSTSDVFYLTQTALKAQNRRDGKQAPEAAAASARVAAWAAIDLILELATVGPSDQMDAIMAAKYRDVHNDYEDNLVVACAKRVNARLLVTNDEQLIRHSPVATMNPRDALTYLTNEFC